MKRLSWEGGLVLLAVLAFVVLTPYARTGYFQDDSINSVLPGYLKLWDLSFPQFLAREMKKWFFVHARVYPLAVAFSYSVWQFVTELWMYRLLQVVSTVGNLVLFVAMIRALGGGTRLALLSGLVVLSLFQLRNFHDPITSYALLMQLGMGLGAAAVLLFARRPGWGLAFYAAALMVYETELAFFPVMMFLAYQARGKSASFAQKWGPLLVTAVYLGSVVALRLTRTAGYDGTQIKLSARAFSTFFNQFSAALPLTYSIFGRSGLYSAETLISPEFLTVGMFAMLAAGSVFFYLVLTRAPDGDDRPRTPAALRVFGWSLALIPPVIVSLSGKYQDEVNRPGIGYLPVYLSYFGVAILIAGALARSRFRKTVALAFGLTLATAFSANQIAASRINIFWKDPRVVFEKALSSGLLFELEPDARVSLVEPYYWVTRELVYHYSGKAVRLEGFSANEKSYAVSVHMRSSSDGEVALAVVQDATRKEDGTYEHLLSSKPIRIARVSGAKVHLGWVQGKELDLLSPQLWELPLR